MKRLFLPMFTVTLLISGIVLGPYSAYPDESVKNVDLKSKRSGGSKMEKSYKALFHLDLDDEDRFMMALGNIKNLFKEVAARQCEINVVANGKAVKFFRKDSLPVYARTIEELHNLGVHFKMCRNALANNHMTQVDLLDCCETVAAGILEIIDLQRIGFAYIKP